MEIKTYSVIAWDHSQTMATFDRAYKTKKGAFRMMDRIKADGSYYMANIRENTKWTDCHIEVSTPIYKWEIAQ